MSNVFKWAAVFIGAFLFQSSIASSISIFGVKPDLLVLVLFMFAVKCGVLPATYVGFFIGLAQDLYTPGILGQNALAKTVAGFFAGLFNEKVVRVDPILQVILIFIVFIVNDSIFLGVQLMRSGGSMNLILTDMITATVPRALYSLVFAALPLIWENFVQPAVKR